MPKDGHIKFILPILAISSVGFLSLAMHFQYRKRAMKVKKIIPQLLLTDSGRMDRIERFSHYVARQMGFGDMKECPQLCKLAYDYLTKSKGCEDNIYVYFSSEPNADSLCMKLIEEFDKCILAYFAFHWSHAPHMISQVLSVDSETKPKLKDIVMAATRFCYTHRWAGKFRYQHMLITAAACTSSLATYHGRLQSLDHLHKWGPVKRYMVVRLSRSTGKVVVRTRRDVLKFGKQRFERVMKDLKVARVFSTLVEEMKAIGVVPSDDQHCTDVMVPAALSERSPVLLLMGGGMGAGKSTVLKDILHESFWSSTEGHAVVVEADAFKETDVIYRALNSRGHHHDMLQTAELVHQSSMDAASSLLVTALNEGRDVIMDGTLSWEPFVEQTIAMARNVHRHRYRMGVGYKTSEDGTITENYWEEVEEQATKRRPYRIELVGVVCDAYLAVVRGMRRAILNRRAVRVKSQLTSHKRFANAFPHYCQLVDKARLFSTNAMGSPPKLIGWKDGDNDMLVDPHEIDCLKRVSMLNEEANSVYELHPQAELMSISRSVWNEVVLAPSRVHLQRGLKIAVQKIENPTF